MRIWGAPDMLGTLIYQLQRSEEGKLRRFFMRRFRNASEAADATQETYLRLLEVQERTVIENPQAYLFQIAKSVAHATSARLAANAKFLVMDDHALGLPDDAPGQDRIVQGRQCLLLLAKTIEKLPRRCQEVFILSRLHGLSNREIADLLGISQSGVEKHIATGLIRCLDLRQDFFSDWT